MYQEENNLRLGDKAKTKGRHKGIQQIRHSKRKIFEPVKELAISTSLESEWSRGTDCLTCTSPDSKKPNNFEPPTHPAGKLQEMFRSGNPYPGGHRRGGISTTPAPWHSANTQLLTSSSRSFKHWQFRLQNLDDISSRSLQRASFSGLHPSKAERSLNDLHAY